LDQFTAQLRQLAPAALEGRAMVELGIHGPEIPQKQLDGIHLALVDQGRWGLGRRRLHGRGKRRDRATTLRRPNFPSRRMTNFHEKRKLGSQVLVMITTIFLRNAGLRCRCPAWSVAFITKPCWPASTAARATRTG
jgi:hypothetical protein